MDKRKTLKFWRSDWLVGLLVSGAMLALANSNWLQTVERKVYDISVRLIQRTPSDQIAVIAIDQPSLESIGEWPWSRDLLAEMIDKLTDAKAKVVAMTPMFPLPQRDAGLGYIERLTVLNNARLAAEASIAAERSAATAVAAAQAAARKQGEMRVGTRGVPSEVGAGRTVAQPVFDPAAPLPMEKLPPAPDPIASVLIEAAQKLDTDRRLAAAIGQAGNVVLPILFRLGPPAGASGPLLPEFVAENAVSLVKKSAFAPVTAIGVETGLVDALGSKAAAVGHLNMTPDIDGVVRSVLLVVDHFGEVIPSFSLQVAARALDLSAENISVRPGSYVKLGKTRIATDQDSGFLPVFYGGHDQDAFPVDSFSAVRNGEVSSDKYRNKIVLIGVTATGIGSQFMTPAVAAMPAVVIQAHTISSLMSGHYFVVPAWGNWVEIVVFLVIALYLILLLPRLSVGAGAGATTLLLVLLLGTHFGLLLGLQLWLKLALAAMLLLSGHVLLVLKRCLLGQPQTEVPVVKPVEPKPSTVAIPQAPIEQTSKTLVIGREAAEVLNQSANEKTMVLSPDPVGHSTLGHYRIEKTLGKGAMGVVYQGHDTRDNRAVAIKTMALSQEFDADELVEVKERFFREVETAGRLNHPNIVTMFEAGEENGLAFIAMEFLPGGDMSPYTQPGSLLPLPKVVDIVARVADALDYAHANQVVHRDIKPANIMYEPASDQVKVTDFGIARITDSSKTKTGMVLGTPSYMSPEQLTGKKVDGRSDLFSLGVTFYLLCSGQLPFVGDSMAKLMFKIASDPHPDIRASVSGFPDGLAQIIDKLLMKDPAQRYQTGSELARDLRAQFATLQAGS